MVSHVIVYSKQASLLSATDSLKLFDLDKFRLTLHRITFRMYLSFVLTVRLLLIFLTNKLRRVILEKVARARTRNEIYS